MAHTLHARSISHGLQEMKVLLKSCTAQLFRQILYKLENSVGSSSGSQHIIMNYYTVTRFIASVCFLIY
jgi:hypothetical protein